MFDERRLVLQNSWRNFMKMCGARGGPEKPRGGAQQDLRVLQGCQLIPKAAESGLLLAKYEQRHELDPNPV